MDKELDALVSTTIQLWRVIKQNSHSCSLNKTATMLQVHGLRHIENHPRCTMGGFADHLGMSLSSGTQLVGRMVRIGLVERINDPKDRRIIRLAVTSAGSKKIQDLEEKKYQELKTFFSKVPRADLKELLRIQTNLLKKVNGDKEK